MMRLIRTVSSLISSLFSSRIYFTLLYLLLSGDYLLLTLLIILAGLGNILFSSSSFFMLLRIILLCYLLRESKRERESEELRVRRLITSLLSSWPPYWPIMSGFICVVLINKIVERLLGHPLQCL